MIVKVSKPRKIKMEKIGTDMEEVMKEVKEKPTYMQKGHPDCIERMAKIRALRKTKDSAP